MVVGIGNSTDDWEDVATDDGDWEDVSDNYLTRRAGIEPQEEYGLGETIVRGVAGMPRQFMSRLMQMQEGVSADEIYDQDFTSQFIEESRKQTADYMAHVPEGGETLLGFSQRDVGETLSNLPYSAAIWTAMAAGAVSPIPGGTVAAGLVGGKRMASNEFARTYKESLDQELMAERGAPLSQEEWSAVYQDFESKADAYGWWESIPETVGTIFGAKLLFGGMKAIVGKKIADKVAGKISGILGQGLMAKTAGMAGRFGVTAAEEVGQEVVTGMGQAGIEHEIGLRPEKPTIAEIFQEVKNPTLLTTAIMGVGGAAGIKAYNKIAGEEKNLLDPDDPSWQDSQRTETMNRLIAGVHDGSVGFEQIREMRQAMDPSDPLARILDDVFFYPLPPDTADYRQQVRNQAEINQTDLDTGLAQPSPAGPEAAPATEPGEPPLAGISRPLEGVVPSRPPDMATPVDMTWFEEKQAREAEKERLRMEPEVSTGPFVAAGIERPEEPEYQPPTGPILPGEEKPTATFIGWQEDGKGGAKALYNVPRPDGKQDTWTAGTLEEKGIEVPETPDFKPVEPTEIVTPEAGEAEEIDAAAQEAATSVENDLDEPTDGQIAAGNYKKGHPTVQGFDITIENPEGSTRKEKRPGDATDDWEPSWSTTMKGAHYGYFKRSEGKDGDQIDVFVGPAPESESAFIVDQVSPETGEFDEHKVLMGFESEEAAKEGYLANYEEGWQGLGDITEVSMDELKGFVEGGRQTEPYATPEAEELEGPTKIGNIWYDTISGEQWNDAKQLIDYRDDIATELDSDPDAAVATALIDERLKELVPFSGEVVTPEAGEAEEVKTPEPAPEPTAIETEIAETDLEDIEALFDEKPEAKPKETKAPKAPADTTVKVKAVSEKTGSIFEIEQNAKEALGEVDDSMKTLSEFLDCLKRP